MNKGLYKTCRLQGHSVHTTVFRLAAFARAAVDLRNETAFDIVFLHDGLLLAAFACAAVDLRNQTAFDVVFLHDGLLLAVFALQLLIFVPN